MRFGLRWCVRKNRCRYGYRCCPEVWLVTPPDREIVDFVDNEVNFQFDSWGEAMRFVCDQLMEADR